MVLDQVLKYEPAKDSARKNFGERLYRGEHLGTVTVPYHRSDGLSFLLTYDRYEAGSGKIILEMRYQPNLVLERLDETEREDWP